MTNKNNKYKIGTAAIVLVGSLLFNGNYISTSKSKDLAKILEPAYADASESKNLVTKLMTMEIPKMRKVNEQPTAIAAEDDSIDYMKYVGLAKSYESNGEYKMAIGSYLEAAKRLDSRDAKIVSYTDIKYSKDGTKGNKLDEQVKCYVNAAKNYIQTEDYENANKYAKMAKLMDPSRYSDNQEINSIIKTAEKAKKEIKGLF